MTAEEPRHAYPARRGDDGSPPVSLTGIELDTYRVYRGGEKGAAEAAEPGFSLRDLLMTLFSHKWKIVISFIVCSVGATAYVSRMPESYESEARVYIRRDRATLGIDPSAAGGRSMLRGMGALGDVIVSEMGIMMSANLAEEVVDRLGPEAIIGKPPEEDDAGEEGWLSSARDRVGRLRSGFMDLVNLSPPDLSARERAIRAITRGLVVRPTMAGSNIIQLRYTSGSPEISQAVLSSLLDAYEVQHIIVHRSNVRPEFFEDEAAKHKIAADRARETLDQRRRELDIASVDTERDLLLQQIGALDTNLQQTRAEITSMQVQTAEYEKLLEGTAEQVELERVDLLANPTLVPVQERLVQLMLDKSRIATRYQGDNRELKEIRQQIEDLKAILEGDEGLPAEIRRGINPARAALKTQYDQTRISMEGLIARERSLSGDLGDCRARLNRLMVNQRELAALERDVVEHEEKYRQYSGSAETAMIEKMLDQDKVTNMRVLQEANMPMVSTKSQRKMLALLAFGAFMGLAVGLGMAFMLEFVDHSLKTSEDVEAKLGLPVLVALPRMRGHKPVVGGETG